MSIHTLHDSYILLPAEDTDMRPNDDSDEEVLPLPPAAAGSLRPGIVHRLDKGTTGQSTTGEKGICEV